MPDPDVPPTGAGHASSRRELALDRRNLSFGVHNSAYETAVTVLDSIRLMIDLAEVAHLPPHTVQLLHRARSEAEDALRRSRAERPSSH